MSQFEDQPLRQEPLPPGFDEEPPRPKGPSLLVPVIVIGVVAAGIFFAWWYTERAANREPQQVVEAPASTGTDQPLEEEAVALPPLDQMDAFLRELLGALSSRPELVRWLATDDLIRQMAAAIDRASRGINPAGELKVLTPPGTFQTQGPPRRLTIGAASWRRYDGLADTFVSMDPAAVAKAYRTIQPRLNEAYRARGYPDGNVDQALGLVIDKLLATPAPDPPIRVVIGRGSTWAYDDPALEGLEPVQKQLLRMGPDNVRRVQSQLRDIAREANLR